MSNEASPITNSLLSILLDINNLLALINKIDRALRLRSLSDNDTKDALGFDHTIRGSCKEAGNILKNLEFYLQPFKEIDKKKTDRMFESISVSQSTDSIQTLIRTIDVEFCDILREPEKTEHIMKALEIVQQAYESVYTFFLDFIDLVGGRLTISMDCPQCNRKTVVKPEIFFPKDNPGEPDEDQSDESLSEDMD